MPYRDILHVHQRAVGAPVRLVFCSLWRSNFAYSDRCSSVPTTHPFRSAVPNNAPYSPCWSPPTVEPSTLTVSPTRSGATTHSQPNPDAPSRSTSPICASSCALAHSTSPAPPTATASPPTAPPSTSSPSTTTTSTVKTHLSSAMRKVSVTNRTELAAMLTRRSTTA